MNQAEQMKVMGKLKKDKKLLNDYMSELQKSLFLGRTKNTQRITRAMQATSDRINQATRALSACE